MGALSVLSLIVSQTADDIFTSMLELAAAFGLPTTTWRTGDPTRTTLRADATLWAQYDAVQAIYAKSQFLATAEGDWLSLRAQDVYNVTKAEATYATPSITLVNAGGGLFEIEPGGLVVNASGTGGTFVNQSTVTINPSSTLAGVLMISQVAGADGTVEVNDIDTIVSPPLPSVTISASTASTGVDATIDADLRAQCLATLGALSPDGPADAYEFVARNSTLTGVAGITRAKADGNNTTGAVTVYAATATASISSPTIAAIQAAVDQWATPLCSTATVVSGAPVTVAFTISGPASGDLAAIQTALDAFLASIVMSSAAKPTKVPISGAYAAIIDAIPALRTVPLHISVPVADVSLSAGQFPVRGTVTIL